MIRTTVDDAETKFRELIDAALRGEEVLITDDDTHLTVKISRVPETDSNETPRPRFGSAKGKIWIADDFDEPLDEFADYRAE